MPVVRFRLMAGEDDTQNLMNFLQSVDNVERVEEVDDLMKHKDDEDSSSAGLSDVAGPGLHCVEAEAPDDATAEKLRDLAQEYAYRKDLTIEFVDRF